MSLFIGVAVILVVLNVSEQLSILPNTYKDVFIPGSGGKPALGTTSSTCWARGGICIDIRKCPELRMDIGVSGCAWGYKVCCKVHAHLSPTVGVVRRAEIPTIDKLEDLGSMLMITAQRNSVALFNIGRMNEEHTGGEEQTEDEIDHVDVFSLELF